MRLFVIIKFLAILFYSTSISFGGLINPDFEYGIPLSSLFMKQDANTHPSDGWFTTATDGEIEIWAGYDYLSNGNPVFAFSGNNFVEINGNEIATLYQTTTGLKDGDLVDFHFAHRGREGPDTMRLTISNETTSQNLFVQDYTTDYLAWQFYTGSILLGNNVQATDTIRFSFEAISTFNNQPTVGNFLDYANFGIGVNSAAVPEPGTWAGLVALGCWWTCRRKRI